LTRDISSRKYPKHKTENYRMDDRSPAEVPVLETGLVEIIADPDLADIPTRPDIIMEEGLRG